MDDLTLLRLQVEWGADEALAEDPVDRLRPIAPPVAMRTRAAPGVPVMLQTSPEPAAPVGTPAEQAVAAAGRAESIDALRAVVAAFEGCALRETASHLVFAEGDPATGLMLIGEPPGADEDRAGQPFAGREGALLDKMLGSIGLTRDAALRTPLIPWRPPGGRPPNPSEIAICLPFLHRLIALAEPTRVVILGSLAARMLFGTRVRRRRTGPEWEGLTVPGLAQPVPTVVLPSLAEVLQTPLRRRDAWAGWRVVRRALDSDLKNK